MKCIKKALQMTADLIIAQIDNSNDPGDKIAWCKTGYALDYICKMFNVELK